MIARLSLSPIEAMQLTYRQLIVMHDAYCLESWDHTAMIAAQLHAISCLVTALGGGKRNKPQGMTDFHPYRKKTRSGMLITADDISPLRLLGNALTRR